MAPPSESGGVSEGEEPVWVSLLLATLKVLAFTYDILAFLPYQLIYKPYQRRVMSQHVKARRLDDSDMSSPFRSVESFDKLATTLDQSCSTLDELFERAVTKNARRQCLGWREVFKEEDEKQKDGRMFKKLVLGDYHWSNYIEVNTMAEHLGAGLQTLDQSPGHNIVLFADTSPQWMISIQAAFKYSFPVVTVYATLGEEGILHSINESEASHIITSQHLLPKLKNIISSLPKVTHIVYIEASYGNRNPDTSGFGEKVTVLSMTLVMRAGEEILSSDKQKLKVRPGPDDLAVIMYTSGSTGLPKGVMITHRNLMAGMAGQCPRIPNLGSSDTYIGYLPLAHVLELSAEVSCLANGAKIGYSSPLTLTDNAGKIKRGCKGDISILKPTLMAAVPVIMDRIYKTVWEKVSEGSPLARALFKWSYERKLCALEAGSDTPLLNRVIFSKISAILGGRLRLMLSGGAPLAGQTQRFMNICFCCPVGQGYGLTETCGAGTIQDVCDLSTGRVGAPLVCNDIGLVEWVEGGYAPSDLPFPRGEVVIGGDNVTLGYYKMPDKTNEDYKVEAGRRWFYTGDIGQVEADGCLRIIDRKKDLVKLQTGEYISLGRVESQLKTCPMVENICVYADSDEMYTVGLIVASPKQLHQLASRLGRAGGGGDDGVRLQSIVKDPVVVKEVLKVIQEHGKKVQLSKFEVPAKITLYADPWTPDTGLVTDALKLKRKNITSTFKADLDHMYAKR